MPAPRKKASPNYRGIIIAAVLVLLLLALRGSPGKDRTVPETREDVSQLSSVDKYIGNAVAARSFSDGKYKLNLTAFLGKPQTGQVYTVRLVSETLEPKTVELGEMAAAGDVYTLHFETEVDYGDYSAVEVVLLDTKTKTETILLRGSF